MRASASTLAATILFLIAASIIISAYSRQAQETARTLRELYDEYVRAYAANLRWELRDGRLVLLSSSPIKVLAVLMVNETDVKALDGEFVLDGEYIVVGSQRDRVVVVLEGGGYVVVDPESQRGNSSLGDKSNDLQLSYRLLPLLARYLDPIDYDSVTRSYYPVNVSFFQLKPGYRPYVSWGTSSSVRHCYDNLLYVHLTWNSSHWLVTYRACAADGPVLDVISASRSSTSTPHREYLYHRECSTSNGVRYCFEIYASVRGWCSHYCENPQSSRWHFDVGMRVIYRFEPLDPTYKIIVIMNRTTYEAAIERGCVTCRSQLEWAGVCYYCSNAEGGLCDTSYGSWDAINSGIVMALTGTFRPVFHWRVRHPESLESTFGDDGYELGAWYPHTFATSSVWSKSDRYAYVVAPSVSIELRVSGTLSEDYLVRASTYHYGYYRILFDLIFDEGGFGGDSRIWDYGVVTFLLYKTV